MQIDNENAIAPNKITCHLISRTEPEREVLSLPVNIDGIDIVSCDSLDDGIYDRFLVEVEKYLQDIIPVGIDDSVVWTETHLLHLFNVIVNKETNLDVLFTSGFSELFGSFRPLFLGVSDEPPATHEAIECQRQRLIGNIHHYYHKRWTTDGTVTAYASCNF
jgi:hypothetical protein